MHYFDVESQLKALTDVLNGPFGVLAIALFAIIVLFSAVRGANWVYVGAILYISTLSRIKNPHFENTLVFPFQELRWLNRPIILALLTALLIPAFLSRRGWRVHPILGGTVVYFLYQVCLSGRYLLGGDVAKGGLEVMALLLIFVTLVVGMPRWLQTEHNAQVAVRCIVITGTLFLLGTMYVLALNPHGIIFQGRVCGTASNSISAGVVCAGTLPAALYMLMRSGESKIWRTILPALIGFLVVMLVWTGSRTALLVGLVGVGLFVRLRFGKALPIVIVCGIFVLLAVEMYGSSMDVAGRLFSSIDTRSRVWRLMYSDFLESPWIGKMAERKGGSENSFLLIGAQAGLLALIPCLLGMLLTAVSMFRLERVKRQLGDYRLLADLVIASLSALAAGAVFEGYLTAVLHYATFLVYIYLALLAFLLDMARVGAPAVLAIVDYGASPDLDYAEGWA